ncbi:hypothetical protein BCA37_25695 [Mycobacterium sp. djl-10]|nr:hypothetical protein BCA37_25695 [Mycobacterium sp. djl-10]
MTSIDRNRPTRMPTSSPSAVPMAIPTTNTDALCQMAVVSSPSRAISTPASSTARGPTIRGLSANAA